MFIIELLYFHSLLVLSNFSRYHRPLYSVCLCSFMSFPIFFIKRICVTKFISITSTSGLQVVDEKKVSEVV